MILGAPACVPTEATSIIPTGETNPLPGDSTKTAESPTDAPIELMPTVVNPATQELTLVPETEVATQMPTIITLISEPTKTDTLEPTATEMPTPTKEKSLIEGNIFFDPQSEADFDKVVESPSPIDEPEKFAAWQDEYLKMIEEKLETYEGSTIDAVRMAISFDASAFSVGSKDWPVIAAYKFAWKEHEILTKTFVFKDSQGNLMPVSATYTTSDSILFNLGLSYNTPILKEGNFRYAWTERIREVISDKFAEIFLPIENTNLDAQRRAFFGSGDSDDRDVLSRSRFMIQWSQ